MRNKTKISILTIAVLTSLFLGFQNCAKTPLEFVDNTVLSTPNLSLKGNFCSKVKTFPASKSKFVFILDLSASNFGYWTPKAIGSQTAWYWDPALATDPNADRFKAIEYFLDNCSEHTGEQFAFIGFSGAAGVLSGGNLSCDTVTFTTKDQIKTQMTAIKARIEQDKNWYNRWLYPNHLMETRPDSIMSGVTSYLAASKCLEKIMINDLTTDAGNGTDNYHTFFLSDGLPEDNPDTGCNLNSYSAQQKAECHMEQNLKSLTMSRTAAYSKGKNLTVQGIYYGDTSGTLPLVLDALSREGGTQGVIKLDSFSNNQNAICELVVAQNSVVLKPDLYGTINLTTYMRLGQVVSDSDMDGLDDELEVSLGYDPQNPRSLGVSGVLDGICHRLGGRDACMIKRSGVTCDPNKWDPLGMTECDHKILGLNNMANVIEMGVDSDSDGLPDYIEIIKNMDPAKADMHLDPDGDGRTNMEEILLGTDPYYSDANVPSALFNTMDLKYRKQSPSTQCTQGDWLLSTEQVQFSKTLPVSTFPEELAVLRHPRNAQVMLMLYRLNPLNSVEPTVEFYGQYVRVTATGTVGAEILEATPSEMTPDDFKLIGKAHR